MYCGVYIYVCVCNFLYRSTHYANLLFYMGKTFLKELQKNKFYLYFVNCYTKYLIPLLVNNHGMISSTPAVIV